ncbi:ABC transporter ATP-binding protein [Lachnoclostridium sp. Marseille-P6806]|uniref:ABC transporter ATP-binding protein n=1 Tax=Lachnoclostridium sp. Marseille-P6806 TaxID=2364793 RepID=UPI001030690F|nr:ABC transporter ATP-binding protein [Lachnoclostridium sp. Marseille-P6806]
MGGQTRGNSLLHYILKFAGDSKSKYIKSIIYAVIGVICSMIPYFIMGRIVKQLLFGERAFRLFLQEGLWMTLFFILRIVFHTLSTSTSHKTTFALIGKIRTELCEKLAKLPLGTVLDIPSGALKNILVERVDSIEPTLAHVVPEFTANILAPVIMFVYLLTIDWRMALLSLATLPIAMICMMWMFKDYESRFRRTQETTKTLNDTAVEYIGGIEVIKAFGKAESSYARFVNAAKDNADSFIDWMRSCIIPYTVAMTAAPATLLSVLPIGAIFVMHGSLALADYVMILILSCGLITPLITVMSYNDDIGKATSIFGDIDDVLELPELVRPEKSKGRPKDSSIVLSHVRFGYKDTEVLHGIDLTIPEGTVTALVGPSGSGKSTIARLIASLWDVNSGSITLGGMDIRELSIPDYNKQVAYVSQDTFLFNTTIRENIRMGKPDAADAQVEQIARDSGCYDFIMELENGFDTVVGGSGVHLSGGERQRVSIARAMMKNAPVLILDEATAYTDPENEAVIQRSVARLAKGRTLIVIAHRLSTIVDSDQIVVVKDGRIEEKGTHTELLTNSKLYRNMWEAHISARDTAEEGGVPL